MIPVLLSGLVQFSSPALFLVADNEQELTDDAPPTVIVKPVTEIEFTGAKVNGNVVGPEATPVFEPGRLTFAPLIQLRSNFTPEMVQSVGEVR